jgi:hypothetical protein
LSDARSHFSFMGVSLLHCAGFRGDQNSVAKLALLKCGESNLGHLFGKATDLDAHAKSADLQAFIRVAGRLLERQAVIRKWSMVSELTGTNR